MRTNRIIEKYREKCSSTEKVGKRVPFAVASKISRNCCRCGKIGHIAANCRSRMKNCGARFSQKGNVHLGKERGILTKPRM